MSWKLIGSPRTQKATKRLAEEFARMDPAPHDRPLSERRLEVYRQLLAAGKFRPVTWASAYCKETGGTYRVNGKHTSHLLAVADPTPDMFVTVERYECDTLDDVGRLYATFDSKMMARTASDINLSFAACVPILADVPGRIVNLAVAGMGYHLGGDKYMRNSQPAERAERLLEQPEFVVWLADVLGGKARQQANQHLKRAAICAAIYATWLKDSPDALKFWKEVRDETGASPTIPTRKLARYLVANFARASHADRRPGNRIADREVYVKCLLAWNAWRREEPTNLQYHAKADLPKAV